jgi:hypothetical protein
MALDIKKLTYETYINYDLRGYLCANFYYDGLNILECPDGILQEFITTIKPADMDLWDDVFIFDRDETRAIAKLEYLGINKI